MRTLMPKSSGYVMGTPERELRIPGRSAPGGHARLPGPGFKWILQSLK